MPLFGFLPGGGSMSVNRLTGRVPVSADDGVVHNPRTVGETPRLGPVENIDWKIGGSAARAGVAA